MTKNDPPFGIPVTRRRDWCWPALLVTVAALVAVVTWMVLNTIDIGRP